MAKKIRVLAAILAAVLFSLCFVGCASCKDKKAVATCGEYEIPYEYLRFVTLNTKADLATTFANEVPQDQDGTIWDDPELAKKYEPLLEEKVWALIADNYALLVACEEYGIGKDVFEGKEIEKSVDASMDALIATYDTYREYEAALEASFMTEDVFRFHFALEEMKVRLYQAMAKKGEFIQDEEEFFEWLSEGNYAYVQHIKREVGDGDESEAEYFFAEQAYTELISAVDPVAALEELIGLQYLNEDTSNTTPYFIFPHAYDDALVEAALNLGYIGQVSPITESNGDYYILVLMEEEEGALSSQLTDLLALYQWGVIAERVEETKQDIKITKTKYGKEINLLEIE